MKKVNKSLLCLLMAFILLISCVHTTYADSSNGQTGEGTINSPYSGYYYIDQYGWRISMYVAKDIGLTESEYRSSSLTEDFYFVGIINIINNITTITPNTKFGEYNKLQYLENYPVKFSSNIKKYIMSDCPAPPIACEGNIDEVNAYFLRNTTIMSVLDKLVDEQELDERFDLVRNLNFTCHYYDENGEETYTVTKSGEEWGESLVLPYSERDNAVPWVIVYEPMVCVHLAGEEAQIFMTATEMAMSQGLLYNWHTIGSDNSFVYTWNGFPYLTSKLKPQCVQSLAFKNLPASVSLQYPWFGFSTIEKSEGEAWSAAEIRDCGGWGMGFLSSKNINPADSSMSLEAIEPNSRYTIGTDVISSFILHNNGENDVRPGDKIKIHFTAQNQNGTKIYETDSEFVALPAGESEYVWFSWKVPQNAPARVVCKAELVSSVPGIDGNAQLTAVTGTESVSHTPATAFTDEPTSGFPVSKPKNVLARASWYYWKYENGRFTKVEENVNLAARCSVSCDEQIMFERDEDTMRAGYGFLIYGDISISGNFTGKSVILPQNAKFTFPEFLYSDEFGCYESGIKADRTFFLRENPDAGNKAIHYVPIWYPDGVENYSVCETVSDCWTPAGHLWARGTSIPISINGTIYDDWYIGY